MEEKRLFKRRHLIFYLQVFSGRSKKPLGFLVDIHTQGFMLTSEKPILIDKVFKLKMALPETISDKKHVSFEARSIWCKKGINTDFYETGFEFIHVAEKDLLLIEELVNVFGFND